MPTLTLPKGQSLRQIARRFDFELETLMHFISEHEADDILAQDLHISVPKTFLDRKIQHKDKDFQHIQPVSGSMNPWLALDIEQKRTRSAGGIHAKEGDEFETQGVEGARRAYLYFEATSNELCIDLCNQLSATHAVEIRAHAFALQALAYAQRYWLFLEPANRAKAAALSAAKAATMAHPKLVEAHLATAMAYRIDSNKNEHDLALEALKRALALAPNSSWCWTELGKMLAADGQDTQAQEAAQKALEYDFEYPLAHELMGTLALSKNNADEARQCFQAAADATPTYANPLLRIAIYWQHAGDEEKAEAFREEALERAQRDRYKSGLRNAFEALKLHF